MDWKREGGEESETEKGLTLAPSFRLRADRPTDGHRPGYCTTEGDYRRLRGGEGAERRKKIFPSSCALAASFSFLWLSAAAAASDRCPTKMCEEEESGQAGVPSLVPPVAVLEWKKGAMESSKICNVHCAVEDSTAMLLPTQARDQRDLIQYLFPSPSSLSAPPPPPPTLVRDYRC